MPSLNLTLAYKHDCTTKMPNTVVTVSKECKEWIIT